MRVNPASQCLATAKPNLIHVFLMNLRSFSLKEGYIIYKRPIYLFWITLNLTPFLIYVTHVTFLSHFKALCDSSFLSLKN